MNRIERLALQRALRKLRQAFEEGAQKPEAAPSNPAPSGPRAQPADAETATPGDAAQPQDQREGQLAALRDLLARAAAGQPALLDIDEKEPKRAIDAALAYLRYAPGGEAKADFQSTYDEILASNLVRSWPMHVAVALLFAVIVGGELWLGFSTTGALASIQEQEDFAAAKLQSQQKSSVSAIEGEEQRLVRELARRQRDTLERTAKQLGRIEDLAKDAEQEVAAKIEVAAQEVVAKLGPRARKSIGSAEASVRGRIEGMGESAVERLKLVEDTFQRSITQEASLVRKALELERAKGEANIRDKVGQVIAQLQRDTQRLDTQLVEATRRQQELESELAKQRAEAARIERILGESEGPGGVLERAAAVADVAAVVLWAMFFAILAAAAAALAALLGWNEKPPVRLLLSVVLFVPLVVGAFALGASWTRAQNDPATGIASRPDGPVRPADAGQPLYDSAREPQPGRSALTDAASSPMLPMDAAASP